MGRHILEKVILNKNGDRMSKAKDFLKEKMREDFKLIGDVDEKILKNTNLREKYLAPAGIPGFSNRRQFKRLEL